MSKVFTTSWLLLFFPLGPYAHAAGTQKGPAFYTDVHGAAAFIQAMSAAGQIDGRYKRYRDQAVPWFLAQRTSIDGGIAWLQNPSAPPDHKSYQTTNTTINNFNAMTLLALYESTRNGKYLKVLQEHAEWLMATAHKEKTRDGDMYFWVSKHPARAGAKPILSGHSWGVGSTLEAMAGIYRVTKMRALVPYMTGGVRFVYRQADKHGAREDERIVWKWKGSKRGNVITGYCRGNAGTLIGVLKVAQVIPRTAIRQNLTIEDVANASLRYLMDEARQQPSGLLWQNMNGRPGERNLGLGRGISGIGISMLMGYQMNRRIGDEVMAKRCLDTARGTIDLILQTLESLDPEEPLTWYVNMGGASDHSGRTVETIGLCSGIVGTYEWLWRYADAVQDDALSRRCDAAIRTMAYRVINAAHVVKDKNNHEMYAWKNKLPKYGGEKSVNMAIDHGQTGVVKALSEIGARLKDEHIIDAAKKSADFVVFHAVQDGRSLKMPYIVPIHSDLQVARLHHP